MYMIAAASNSWHAVKPRARSFFKME
ncbi:hypothetical protein WG8_1230 [Paenibacillus sp. Aloe-11]|nr:hypothetical protein WG8_1230 [Paenibacillus sp. Aloe-11]